MATHTILIVDDEVHIICVLGARLQQAGYGVLAAHNGEEALDLTARGRPALVVTDLQMPVMNGLELARRLKCDAATRDTPVIMLTARGYILEESELADTNIRLLLSKPFSARDIVRRIGEILSGAPAQAAPTDLPRREAA